MKWESWVKVQLRIYLFRQIDLERIEQDLQRLEEVSPRITQYDDSPSQRTPHRNGSVVEFLAIKRDKSRRHLEKQQERLQKQVKVIDGALKSLTPFHRSIIEMAYFSLSYPEQKISEVLNIPVWSVEKHKAAALGHLYDSISLGYLNELNEVQERLQQEERWKEIVSAYLD